MYLHHVRDAYPCAFNHVEYMPPYMQTLVRCAHRGNLDVMSKRLDGRGVSRVFAH